MKRALATCLVALAPALFPTVSAEPTSFAGADESCEWVFTIPPGTPPATCSVGIAGKLGIGNAGCDADSCALELVFDAAGRSDLPGYRYLQVAVAKPTPTPDSPSGYYTTTSLACNRGGLDAELTCAGVAMGLDAAARPSTCRQVQITARFAVGFSIEAVTPLAFSFCRDAAGAATISTR